MSSCVSFHQFANLKPFFITFLQQNIVSQTAHFIGDLCKALDDAFGSFDAFKTKMATQTTAVQGSGWGWLAFNPTTKLLEIAACANQDPLQATTGN